MRFPKGQHPGARWHKCDFQIHTPRDENWRGKRSPSGTQDVDSARAEWAEHFVQECQKRGLTAIAVTDHHDTVFIPYIQDQLEQLGLKETLWFFPGIEVTCNDASQCLLLFDPLTSRQDVQRLFGGHLNVRETSDSLVKTGPVVPCGKDIAQFITDVHADEILHSSSILLPHGGNKADHKTLIKPQFQSRFRDLEADGVYIERPFADLHPSTVSILHGRDPEWGNRRRGVIATGDSRDEHFSELGTKDCWIRLGEPTTESIRQALLADEARITYSAPIAPSQRILNMSVGSTMTGANFTLTFNEGSNAFIGGRGSGKTSVLEYLRFALGRSSLDLTLPDKDSSAREREMLRNTLRGGGVRLTLLRDGVEETWERRLDSFQVITVASSAAEQIVETLNIEQAQNRFFARAFSQKQLSSLIADPKDADEQITGVAAAEVRVERQASLNEIERRKQAVRLSFDAVILHWQHAQALEEAQRQLSDVNRRYSSISGELEKAGLGETTRQVIAAENGFRTASRALSTAQTVTNTLDFKVTDFSSAVAECRIGVLETDDFPELRLASDVVANLADEIEAQLQKISRLIASARASIAEQQRTFETRRAVHDQAYSSALKEQESFDEQLKLLSNLSTEKETLVSEIEALTTQSNARLSAQEELNRNIEALKTEVLNHRTILSKAAAKVEEMSGGMLRATVQPESLPSEYLEAFSDTCDNIRIQNYDNKCREMLVELLKPGGVGWAEAVKILFDLFRSKIRTGAKQPNSEDVTELKRLYGSLTTAQYQGVFTRTDGSRLARLLSAVALDHISFTYSDRGTFIDFAQASPGQQAGALLTLLLNQEAGTLIIDQPEDDLDNRVIMDIVAQMRIAKTRRQLIFSTHNANVVVNGDADKIIVLRPATATTGGSNSNVKICIEVDGAIESRKLKDSITSTLEGGERAFELRRRKYIS